MSQQGKLKELGKAIRAQRKAAGLTQEQLAERCGYDPTYISMLENGHRNPPVLTLFNLARHLGQPLFQILKDIAN
ncbi:MAG: helix-turn-helix transcriptional regulator [Alphaproteobacteria bacterium]